MLDSKCMAKGSPAMAFDEKEKSEVQLAGIQRQLRIALLLIPRHREPNGII
jgi:hypothetical protein